jgi:regulator of protease activity HflC (stomatin/prohibitin superfamily)
VNVKTTFKLVGVVSILALFVAMFNGGLWLMRQPSDIFVFMGAVLLFAAVVAVGTTLQQFVRHMLFIILIATAGIGCAERIDPGHVGIVVNYYGTDKGVDSFPAVTGMNWYNPITTDIFEYPTYVQTTQWTREDTSTSPGNEEVIFNDKDGLSIGVDMSLSYQLIPDKVPAFYVKFRTQNLDAFTHGFMRNIARDAFNELGVLYTAEEIYGAKKEEFLAKVRDRINKQVNDYGVDVAQFGVVGAMRLPENVVQALNNKIQATQDAQRVENELRKAQAEAQKAIAQAQGEAQSQIVRAEGTAKANNIIASSISATLVEWRRIEVQEKTLWRWNGQMPGTVVNGSVPYILPGIK